MEIKRRAKRKVEKSLEVKRNNIYSNLIKEKEQRGVLGERNWEKET